MTLADIASIGSLMSGIAVLVSLVYLNLQTRRSAINQRSLMQQGRAEMVSDWLRSISQADALQIHLRGNAGDTTFDVAQYVRYTNDVWSALVLYENSFVQHRMGVIDETQFAGTLGSLKFQCSLPGFRAFWLQVRATFEHPFAAFIDEIVDKTPVVLNASEMSLATWKVLATQEIGKAAGQKAGAP
jgi:hypothetical protein